MVRSICRGHRWRRGIDPVALSLEGIGRKRTPASARRGIEFSPLKRNTTLPGSGRSFEKNPLVGSAAIFGAQRGHANALHKLLSRHSEQRLAWSNLQQKMASVRQDRQILREANSGENLIRPVLWALRLGSLNPRAGYIGEPRNGWSAALNLLDLLPKRLCHLRHQRSMKRILRSQPHRGNAISRKPSLQIFDSIDQPRGHGHLGTILRSEPDILIEIVSQLCRRQHDSQHDARRSLRHKTAAFRCQANPALKGEDPCNRGRRQFAKAVAQQRRGYNAERSPQYGQGILNQEEHGLRNTR